MKEEETDTRCYNCQITKTPMWRRTLDSQTDTIITLCNACGLYYKSKGCHRPKVLISKKSLITTSQLLDKITQDLIPNNKHKTKSNRSEISMTDDSKPIVIQNEQDIKLTDLKIITCSNCFNMNTSIWRKDENGKNICNACGLYYKKKGFHRIVKNKSKKDDVYFEIDQGNLLRFNIIKRRKRSGSVASTNSTTKSSPVSVCGSSINDSNTTTTTTTTTTTNRNNGKYENELLFRRSLSVGRSSLSPFNSSSESLNSQYRQYQDYQTPYIPSLSTTPLSRSLSYNDFSFSASSSTDSLIALRRQSTDISQYNYKRNYAEPILENSSITNHNNKTSNPNPLQPVSEKSSSAYLSNPQESSYGKHVSTSMNQNVNNNNLTYDSSFNKFVNINNSSPVAEVNYKVNIGTIGDNNGITMDDGKKVSLPSISSLLNI